MTDVGGLKQVVNYQQSDYSEKILFRLISRFI